MSSPAGRTLPGGSVTKPDAGPPPPPDPAEMAERLGDPVDTARFA